jgi:hypothetical protein
VAPVAGAEAATSMIIPVFWATWGEFGELLEVCICFDGALRVINCGSGCFNRITHPRHYAY